MKGKYGGPMTVDQFFQALYQDRDFFHRHNITHLRATYLYFTPCNEFGEPVGIYDQAGNPIDGYLSAGGYQSAADFYDQGQLEPKTIARSRFTP